MPPFIFNNIAYDFNTNKFISINNLLGDCGYNWITSNTDYINILSQFMNQLIPDEEIRKTLFEILYHIIQGKPYNKFVIFHGNINNGIYHLWCLLIWCLDYYCISITADSTICVDEFKLEYSEYNISLFTKRLIDISEYTNISNKTGFGATIKVDILKSLLDSTHYGTFIYVCNNLPVFDKEFKNYVIIPFTSKFVNRISEVDENNNIYLKTDIHYFYINSFFKLIVDTELINRKNDFNEVLSFIKLNRKGKKNNKRKLPIITD